MKTVISVHNCTSGFPKTQTGGRLKAPPGPPGAVNDWFSTKIKMAPMKFHKPGMKLSSSLRHFVCLE